MPDYTNHPCFDKNARHEYSRVHLPVAKECNIQCNFCDRRFDCMNESRPGVTSNLLSPPQALAYVRRVRTLVPKLSVVGIAGPGDPFANADATLETLRLVRDDDPEILLCVASNGLGVPPQLDRLAELKVSHVTITVNAVDPEIGKRIVAWVRDGRQVYRGREAAELLLERQLAAIRGLVARKVLVKVNTIVMPGVNDDHVAEVSRTVSLAGAEMQNCMPLLPVEGTPFGELDQPSGATMKAIRGEATKHLSQMSHCARCRADAVGRLGEEASAELMSCLAETATGPLDPTQHRPYVAVASREGLLVNLHLGEAPEVAIYGWDEKRQACELIETRPTPPPGGGDARWDALAQRLHDCRAVVVSGVGGKPRKILATQGVKVMLTEGLVEDAVESVLQGSTPAPPRKLYRCGEVCSGSGQGCA